jgi:hypothetical protein
MVDHPTAKIRKMIEDFRIPRSDAILDCRLLDRSQGRSVADSCVFFSTKQSEHYYSDIFHFWVRAFFCFAEDMWLGTFFEEAAALVDCRQMAPAQFEASYLELIHSRTLDSNFVEMQSDPRLRIELEKRTFSEAYVVLDQPTIKSAVAASDGEFVAYFRTVPTAYN